MARTKKRDAVALTQEQIAALLALLADAGAKAPDPAPVSAKQPKAAGDIVAQADGFTFAWTREKVKESGAVQYRLAITGKRGKALTHGTGYPYAVREENGTLAERVASAGVPAFARSLAKSLAKK